MGAPEERLMRGAEIRRHAQGRKSESLQAVAGELDPQMPEFIDGFVFGTIWDRPGLSFEERMLIAIGALASQGKTDQLVNYLFGGFDAGVPPRKMKEAIVMAFVYGGFPNASSAMMLWRDVVERARRRGIEVNLGDDDVEA